MKDFDIAKYLREHQLGSYGILNHYVDLKPLKEETEQEYIDVAISSLVSRLFRYNAPDSEAKKNKIKDNLKNLSLDQKSSLKNYGKEVIDYNKDTNNPHAALGTEYGQQLPELDQNIINILTKDLKEAETVSEEDSSEGYTNKLDLAAMETAIQSIVDDLVDDGFPVEEVEQHLKDLISNAAAPYKQKKIVNR